MSIKFNKISLAIAVSLALSACGGSDDSTDAVVDSIDDVSLSGKVIDGYISGAQVFLDKNRNQTLDDGEPSALSDETGAYSLQLSDADIEALPTSPIVALVDEGATDISTGETFDDSPLVLISPPIFDANADNIASFSPAVTPFTTKVYAEIKDVLALVVSGDVSQSALSLSLTTAKETVVTETAALLGLDEDELAANLFDDFLEQSGDIVLDASDLETLSAHAQSETDNLQAAQQIQDTLQATLDDNQQAIVAVKKFSQLEAHTLEPLYLKEDYLATTTTQDNGTKVTEWQITQTRLLATGEQMGIDGESVAVSEDDQLIYALFSGTITEYSDGRFDEEVYGEIDRNGDNDRQDLFKSYKVGTKTATTRTFTEFFDATDPSVEVPWRTWGDENWVFRTYQGGDIKADILAQEYSDIDMAQMIEESTVSENDSLIYTRVYQESFNREGVLDLAQPEYAETLVDTDSATGTLHEIKKDWGADGSINEYIATEVRFDGSEVTVNAGPVWGDKSDDDWKEYADYSWNNNSTLGAYWQEVTNTTKLVDGKVVNVNEGKRSVLDTETNSAKTDEQGNEYTFNTWSSTRTERSDELSVEQVSWRHTKLEDALFNSPEENLTIADDIGQKAAYSVKYANDLWLSWEYNEWGTQSIGDIVSVVDAQLAANGNDYSAVDIGDALGDDAVVNQNYANWLEPTTSFINDAEGNARTWYIVTNAFDGNFAVFETTLPNVYSNWKMGIVGGGSFIYRPDAEEGILGMPPMRILDADKGSFTFEPGFAWHPSYPFYLFLDETEAYSKLVTLVL